MISKIQTVRELNNPTTTAGVSLTVVRFNLTCLNDSIVMEFLIFSTFTM